MPCHRVSFFLPNPLHIKYAQIRSTRKNLVLRSDKFFAWLTVLAWNWIIDIWRLFWNVFPLFVPFLVWQNWHKKLGRIPRKKILKKMIRYLFYQRCDLPSLQKAKTQKRVNLLHCIAYSTPGDENPSVIWSSAYFFFFFSYVDAKVVSCCVVCVKSSWDVTRDVGSYVPFKEKTVFSKYTILFPLHHWHFKAGISKFPNLWSIGVDIS